MKPTRTKKPAVRTKKGATKKDYVAIAASKISKPVDRKKRILVYGRNKKGKSWFGANVPRVLVADPDLNADELKKLNPDVWPIEKWEDMADFIKYCYTAEARAKYDWITIDGCSRLSNMAVRYSMKLEEERDLDRIPGTIDRRIYGSAGELMKGLFFNLNALPYGVIYTAQERQEAGNDDSDDADDEIIRYVPDLPKGARSALMSMVTCITRIYTVKIEKDDKKHVVRRLWLSPDDAFDTGYRSEHVLPDYLTKPSLERLLEMLETGKATK